jgi:hypothetical protein
MYYRPKHFSRQEDQRFCGAEGTCDAPCLLGIPLLPRLMCV